MSIAEHVSVIDQLKDSFDARPDLDQLHEINTLTEDINTHCDSSEDRIKSIIKGNLTVRPLVGSLGRPRPRLLCLPGGQNP